jgi:transposase
VVLNTLDMVVEATRSRVDAMRRQSRIRKEPVMDEPITYVGIDAHARELHVAMLIGDAERPVHWTSATDGRAIERLRHKLEGEAPGRIECCYEAGPTGYTLQRRLTKDRVRCRGIAPSMIPRKPGDRVKTNRRDAQNLAQLLRGGLLTEVHPPTPAAEAIRDLCRARDAVRQDLMRARHRLGKLLLRRGLTFAGRNWTIAHAEWRQQLHWDHEVERYVMLDYQLALAPIVARLTELDRHLEQIAMDRPYAAAVAALRCFRGIDTLTAIMLLAELHDVSRFPHPRALMAFVGLVPSEASTGKRYRRGAITKTGNRFVRRLLVQAAWQYHHEPRLGLMLRRRRVGQPVAVLAIAHKAEQRLWRRYRRRCARGKPNPIVITAIARELVGFLWAMLHLPEAHMI